MMLSVPGTEVVTVSAMPESGAMNPKLYGALAPVFPAAMRA